MMEAITPDLLIEQGKIFKELLLPMMTGEEIEAVLRDTPYVQRIREAGREEGREAGREEGREEGREAGREEGWEEGREEGWEAGWEAMAKTLARILAIRFAVELDHFSPLFKPLSLAALETLSEAALTVDTLADFETRLNELTGQ